MPDWAVEAERHYQRCLEARTILNRNRPEGNEVLFTAEGAMLDAPLALTAAILALVQELRRPDEAL